MSTKSLTGSPSDGSLGRSLAGGAISEIVLTHYAHIAPEPRPSSGALASDQLSNTREQLARQQLASESDRFYACESGATFLPPASGNKLWNISPAGPLSQAAATAACEKKPLAPPHSSGAAFQVVWTDLAFKVELSAYDKLLNGLLRVASALSGGRRRANAPPAQDQGLEQSCCRLSQASASDSQTAASGPSCERRTIFEHLDGHLKSGEITAILGPSGAGKTSLLNALCGRSENYSGSIKLLDEGGDGGDGGVGGRKQRMRLSIIPQKDYLIENLSVRENLLYSSRLLNPGGQFDHEANIARVARMLNLAACFHSSAATISGGEYKRVSIAQELLRQPDILILDEPTSGLDSLNCKQLIRSLGSLIEASRRGQLQPIAIVLTIHQPDVEVFHLFDRVYCLAPGGRVIYDGHPRDALQTIRSQANLLGSQACAGHFLSQSSPPVETTNPANLLIEIASEHIYGPEPIERLSSYFAERFQLAHGHHRLQRRPADDGHQLRLNLLAAAELAAAAAAAAAAVAADQTSCQKTLNLSGSQVSATVAAATAAGHASRASHFNSSASLVSDGSGSGRSGAMGLGLAARGAAAGACKRKQLERDKRLTARNDHSGRFWYHTRVLASRTFLASLRDPMLTLIALLFHLSIPFVMWTVYPATIGRIHACPVIQRQMDMVSMASNRTADRLEDLQEQLVRTFECSTMFFLTTYSFSMCKLTLASIAFPLNMHILLKEVRNGWYNLPAYVLAKTLASFPFEVLYPTVSLVMIYLLLGMPASLYEWRMLAIALVMALVSMISHTQGLIFGALCMDSVQTAIFLASASSLPQTLLSGFTARIRFMPDLLQRLSWLSQYRYSTDLINLIRFGFGICPCDESTDEYLRTQRADFRDVPANLKPILAYYLGNSNANEPAASVQLVGDNMTALASEAAATGPIASLAALNATATATATALARIPGLEYDLMLNETERAHMLQRMESGEVDLLARMADMTGRAFTYGRPLEGCGSVRSQILMTAGTLPDDYAPLLFGCMLGLLLACKILLFAVVRRQIGARV